MYMYYCFPRRISTIPVAGGKLRSDEIFEEIRKTVDAVSPPLTWKHTATLIILCLQEGETLVKKIKGIFLFKITGSGGRESQWVVDLKNGKGSVKNTPGRSCENIYIK